MQQPLQKAKQATRLLQGINLLRFELFIDHTPLLCLSATKKHPQMKVVEPKAQISSNIIYTKLVIAQSRDNLVKICQTVKFFTLPMNRLNSRKPDIHELQELI